MAAGGHFGWPKITFDRISRHFTSIHNFYIFWIFFPQNGCRRPFWMTENHFWSHFSPFQINMQLLFFSQNGCRRPFWMTENHFRSHFSPFHINTQLLYFLDFFPQNGCRRPFWMTENHFRSHFSPFHINTQLLYFLDFFPQNGCRRPFWMTENHFWSHFSPFQINMQLLFFFTKWLQAAILDDWKSLSIACIAVSNQYATFIFFHKMAAASHFGWPKITFDRISHHFTSIHNFYIFLIFFHKMAAGDHFGWPKITFDRISRRFKSICNFYFFTQNGCRQPFWMTENHFQSHVSPFQINTQLLFFHKMAAGGHFGWPKITFDRISRHFTSIHNFYIFLIFSTKWLQATILDDRKSLLIAFLAVSNQYATFIFFHKMAAGGHFGWLKITFNRMYRRFKSIRNFYFFHKMAAGGHFGWPKITFDRISRHFTSIHNFYIFFIFSTKWLPATILDDRKSLLIAFLAVSNQYATFIFFHKMAAGGHFGWLKITFNRMYRRFKSIHNFYFFTKWLPAAILDDRKSLSIAFLAISHQYTTFKFFWFFPQNGCRRPFWMTENHFWSHFSSFQINTQLFFFFFFFKMAAPPFWKSLLGHFWMTENHFRSHFSPFQINTQLFFFWIFLYKITILVIQAITTNYIYYRSVRTEEEENVNKLSI